MAFSLVIRKASSPSFPLGIRTIASLTSFDAPKSRVLLFTACYHVKDIPSNFPFTVEIDGYASALTLTRNYPNETIKVEVAFSWAKRVNSSSDTSDDDNSNDNDDSNDNSNTDSNNSGERSNDTDDADKQDDDNGDIEEQTEFKFPYMVVKVFKGDTYLEFNVSLSHDDISIYSLKFGDTHTCLSNSGLCFEFLSEQLQHGLSRYLEVRGIGSNLVKFLNKVMSNRQEGTQVKWLKKLKTFVKN